MATLHSLKRALVQTATEAGPCQTRRLSDTQHRTGAGILRGSSSGWATGSSDLSISWLGELLAPLCHLRDNLSVLEIGPGADTVLARLLEQVKRKIGRYAAFEPDLALASKLEAGLATECPLPCLDGPPQIHPILFGLEGGVPRGEENKFDVVLFCHRMYGMEVGCSSIRRALGMLEERAPGAIVVVFHRGGPLELEGLACHRTASSPASLVPIADDDQTLDQFAPFVAGFVTQDDEVDKTVRLKWRAVCRALGRPSDEAHPGHLLFSSSQLMLAFTRHAAALPELTAKVPPKLIILVTGKSGAGKDYCARNWHLLFTAATSNDRHLAARAVSISDAIKHEYAATTGADQKRLLEDRAYKEQHRLALTAFFQQQTRQRPQLPVDHFLQLVHAAANMDVLLVTGMRDEAPVTCLSHLVPHSKLIDVRVEASTGTRRIRRGLQTVDDGDDDESLDPGTYCPTLIFHDDATGESPARQFAHRHLLPLLHPDLQRLARMMRLVPDFPRPAINFRHVLDIGQQPTGLALCASLLATHFTGDWAEVEALACCEAGGFVFASALATRVHVPLALIRQAGKLPPPVLSARKLPSHVSSSSSSAAFSAADGADEGRMMEMGRDVVRAGASVVVVDDVLATGRTLCAVLDLLRAAGVGADRVTVLTVAGFPAHRGRRLLRRHGHGRVQIRSLLVCAGA